MVAPFLYIEASFKATSLNLVKSESALLIRGAKVTGFFSEFMNLNAVYLKANSWLSISVSNLVVIISMLVIFFIAISIPFPKDHHESSKNGRGQK